MLDLLRNIQNFIADKVQADVFWLRAIEEISFGGVPHIGSEVFPSLSLGNDTFCEAHGRVAAFRFFGNLKHKSPTGAGFIAPSDKEANIRDCSEQRLIHSD